MVPLADAPPPYGTVVFDCDSTLSAMEGIEELARGPHAAEIARLTDDAMEGRIALEKVFGSRLLLVRPSRADVERIGRLYVERAVPGAARVVAALRALGKEVAIVSGGLLPAVRTLARALGVGEANVHAVDVVFDEHGRYAGFDERSPLARGGGKIVVLERLARALPGPLAFVGDGATDLEAAGCCARFIAFGGVARRESVFARAAITSEDPDLAALLPLLLTQDELARLARLAPSTERPSPRHALDPRPHRNAP